MSNVVLQYVRDAENSINGSIWHVWELLHDKVLERIAFALVPQIACVVPAPKIEQQ